MPGRADSLPTRRPGIFAWDVEVRNSWNAVRPGDKIRAVEHVALRRRHPVHHPTLYTFPVLWYSGFDLVEISAAVRRRDALGIVDLAAGAISGGRKLLMLLFGRDVNGDRLSPQRPVPIPINPGRMLPSRS